MIELEDENNIQPWRQANQFTITTRGHWTRIPEPSTTVQLSDYDPYEVDNVSPQIREIASDGNYNTIYDSFYAPVDFQLTGVAVRIPVFLPDNISYKVSFRVNGSQIEKFNIPEEENYNQKSYETICSSLIFEDDFLEIAITFQGNEEALSWNEHNLVFSVSGCIWNGMYKSIYADVNADVATTKNVNLSGYQMVDGLAVVDDDVVFVQTQSVHTENGLWVVASGAWTRHVDYIDLDSLNNVVIHVLYGQTQNSIDVHNYILAGDGESTSMPIMEWYEGDKWFKSNMHLQNRSGNESLIDRVIIDAAKCTHNFLIQGIAISIVDDPLMVVKQLKSIEYCYFVDIMVNGRTILPTLGFPRPIPIDAETNQFKRYDIGVFNNLEGYPIRFGDVVTMKIYQKNPYARNNGKIIQCVIYGCGPDCATVDMPAVAVYEPCTEGPCEWTHQFKDKCDPKAAKESRTDPEVNVTDTTFSTDESEESSGQMYVVVNGERVWL